MSIKTKFGQRVKKLRKSLGLSQIELGKKSNLHRNYIGNIERGEQNICLENIEILAKALEIEIKDLFIDL